MNKLLGVDLALSPDGDLAVQLRDLVLNGDERNVVEAFARELTTPYGYLGRFLHDIDGIKILDEDYGNRAYYVLSEPVSIGWIDYVHESIAEVADGQPRISLLGIDYQIIASNNVRFNIHFQILNAEPKTWNMVLERKGQGMSIGGISRGN